MSLGQRLARLEIAEQGRLVYQVVEQIADQHGVAVDEVLRLAQEIGARVERWGLDAELRRFARDHGLSDEEARQSYEAARERYGL